MSHVLNPRERARLSAMDITVWQLRESVLADAVPGSVGPGAEPASRTQALRSEPEKAQVTAAGSAVASQPPAARRGAEQAVAPYIVWVLCKGDVLLAAAPAGRRGERRFAADLLSAASGIWGGGLSEIRFEWPRPGLENTVAASERALGAFLERQISDHPGARILLDETVGERLAAVPEGAFLIPPLRALMDSGEQKRTLWQAIARL